MNETLGFQKEFLITFNDETDSSVSYEINLKFLIKGKIFRFHNTPAAVCLSPRYDTYGVDHGLRFYISKSVNTTIDQTDSSRIIPSDTLIF